MARILALANQKGGVGKTTSAANLAAFLAKARQRVLLVDFDPQGNLSSHFGVPKDCKGVYEVLSEMLSLEDAIVSLKDSQKELYILPSSIQLAGAVVELNEVERKEFCLKELLSPIDGDYDYILIDCPPSLDILTINALVASDFVLVPLQCEYFALEGLSLLVNTVGLIKQNYNTALNLRIVLTMFDQRTNLSQEVVKDVYEHFKRYLFRSIIPRTVYLGEAPSNALTIDVYKPQSRGAKAYQDLAEEVLEYV